MLREIQTIENKQLRSESIVVVVVFHLKFNYYLCYLFVKTDNP